MFRFSSRSRHIEMLNITIIIPRQLINPPDRAYRCHSSNTMSIHAFIKIQAFLNNKNL
jgi:hypothetical protein